MQTFMVYANDDHLRDNVRRGWSDLSIPEVATLRERSPTSIKEDRAWLAAAGWITPSRRFNRASRTYINYAVALGRNPGSTTPALGRNPGSTTSRSAGNPAHVGTESRPKYI